MGSHALGCRRHVVQTERAVGALDHKFAAPLLHPKLHIALIGLKLVKTRWRTTWGAVAAARI